MSEAAVSPSFAPSALGRDWQTDEGVAVPIASAETPVPTLLHGCWEGSTQLAPGVAQRTYADESSGDWAGVFNSDQIAIPARQGLATGSDGSVYVAYAMNTLGLVHKLSSRGALSWSRRWRGQNNHPFAILTLASGDVLVAGEYLGSSCAGPASPQIAAYVTRFAAEGEEAWTLVFRGMTNFDRVMGLAASADDLVVLSGQLSDKVAFGVAGAGLPAATTRHVVLSLDVEVPAVRWASSIGGRGQTDGPTLAATADGGVIASGTTDVGYVVRFDAQGRVHWSRWLVDDWVGRVSVVSDHVWVTVTETAADLTRADWLVRLDQDGTEELTYRLTSPVGGIYRVWGVVPDRQGEEIAVTSYGMTERFDDTRAMVAQKLRVGPNEGAVAVEEFPLWEGVAAAAPVRTSAGAIVTAGAFLKPSHFSLSLGPINVIGTSNLYILHRTP